MDGEYGFKIGQAIRAVAGLHADTSRLLVDCDKHLGKERKSLFGNWATRDLTYNVKANSWMPEGVFRYYEAGSLLVDVVTITFFVPESSGDPAWAPEPLFKVGRIQYAVPSKLSDEGSLKDVVNGWDLWWLFFKSSTRELNKVLTCGKEVDGDRIAWARLIATPLVSIRHIDDAKRLMGLVLAAIPPSDLPPQVVSTGT
ncbi:MAG TPA: hypothetical protein VNY30_07355 [Bryobacteraceae bacterium]|nr:hypothetical protein [Bryobacteraceae bacterium]